jgi:hypothetical protein
VDFADQDVVSQDKESRRGGVLLMVRRRMEISVKVGKPSYGLMNVGRWMLNSKAWSVSLDIGGVYRSPTAADEDVLGEQFTSLNVFLSPGPRGLDSKLVVALSRGDFNAHTTDHSEGDHATLLPERRGDPLPAHDPFLNALLAKAGKAFLEMLNQTSSVIITNRFSDGLGTFTQYFSAA